MPQTKLGHRDRIVNLKYANKRNPDGTVWGNDIQVRVKKFQGQGAEPAVNWSYEFKNCPPYLQQKVIDGAEFRDDISAPTDDDTYNFKRFKIPPINGVTYTLKANYPAQDPVAIKNFTAKQRFYLNFDITESDLAYNKTMSGKVKSAMTHVTKHFARADMEVLMGKKVVKQKKLVASRELSEIRDHDDGTEVPRSKCRAQTGVTIKKKEWGMNSRNYRFTIRKTGVDTFEFRTLGVKSSLHDDAPTCQALDQFGDDKILRQFTIVNGHFLKLFLPESSMTTQWYLDPDVVYGFDKTGGISNLVVNGVTLSARNEVAGPKIDRAFDRPSTLETLIDLNSAVLYADENPGAINNGDDFVFDIEITRYEHGRQLGGWNSMQHGMTLYFDADNCDPKQLAVIIVHELGHGLSMVSPNSPTYHTAEGGQGQHCTYNTTLNAATNIRSPNSDTVDLCIMYWSGTPYTQMEKGFCSDCEDYLRKFALE